MLIPSWKTELKEVAPNVFAYIQGGGPGIDNHSVSNAGLINGDDSSMVIDALTAPVLTKAFIAAMKRINPKPFRHLVNTHHHPDHVRGNCFFLPIEIVAHEKCREAVLEAGLTFPMREDWKEGIEELKLAPPTTTFADRMTYRYGDHRDSTHLQWPGTHDGGRADLFAPLQGAIRRGRGLPLRGAALLAGAWQWTVTGARLDQGSGCGNDRARTRADWRQEGYRRDARIRRDD